MKPHRKKLFWAIALFGILPFAWLVYPYIFDINGSVCFFRNVTGESCFFCGLSRAFAAASRGEFARATEFHSFWWLFVLIILLAATFLLIDGILKTDYTDRFRRKTRRFDGILIAGLFLHGIWVLLF